MRIDSVLLVRLLVLFAATAVITPGTTAADERKATAPELDGKWLFESQTIGGWALPQSRREEIWVEVKDGSFFRCGKGGLRQELRLALDPTREPAEFTLTFKHPVTGKVSESKGIYKIDGGRLTLCYDNSGRTRPAKFESPEGRDEVVLSVLARGK